MAKKVIYAAILSCYHTVALAIKNTTAGSIFLLNKYRHGRKRVLQCFNHFFLHLL